MNSIGGSPHQVLPREKDLTFGGGMLWFSKTCKVMERLVKSGVEKAMKLGLNPKKLGSLANHKQEPWKEPLPDFIDALYEKRYNVKEG